MQENIVRDIIHRLTRLEKEVFSNKSQKEDKQGLTKNFSGPSGGLKLFLSKGFFDKKRTLANVREELEKKNYHYSPKAVDHALRRLSKPGEPLVALKEGGRKVYVKRK